ncbi:hypothetical protein JHD49_00315 [Sulfurimonas sp. SAG-AH-194-C21]|nr:hypothetical protein [Sulfurimonas sp. SAG-AH-194-C21]MDF1882379.1 hypothetical protein [Sulfurimonas sp. SAG-AH-194-C21]
MLFFGHRFLESKSFYHINSIEAITNTPPSSALYIEFKEENLDIITHLNDNDITYALSVSNITQLMYASSLDADFIIVDKELAKTAQNIAESYLFDAKILVSIEDEEAIEECALLGVDGVIFSNAIIKINS